jgi:hypothetical protein
VTSRKDPALDVKKVRDALDAGLKKISGDKGFDENDLGEIIRAEIDRAKLENENETELIALRKKFGKNLIDFLWRYSIVALLVVIVDGIDGVPFNVPENVSVALVGGTAVAVLGVVGTIAAGLFRAPKAKP